MSHFWAGAFLSARQAANSNSVLYRSKGGGAFMSDLTVWVRNYYDVLKDFAGPVATTIDAITAIVVTHRFNKRQIAISQAQRDIALDKLRFDLFELRYGIYLAAKELIEYVSNHRDLKTVDSNHVRSLYVKLDEARFFF